MAKVDLHVHTTASDGHLSPVEVVSLAAERGLSVIAIADHDTVGGITTALEAAEAFPGLRVIPAIELSTDVPRGEVHVLGYFIDYTDPEFRETLEGLRNSRVKRAQGMVAKLGKLGMQLDWERVRELAGTGSIGRPHIAQAMLEKGYITSFKEAFNLYIGREGPAYVIREKMTPAAAVELVLKANGLSVLAHPYTAGEPEELVRELKAAGLAGIEAYYGEYNSAEIDRLVGLADKYGLIATGGSDFHGLENASGTALGSAPVPPEAAERLLALAGPRVLNPAGQ